MRLLYVIARGDAFGGSSLHVMDMATRLREDGHEVRILVGGEPGMEVPERFRERGLDFVCLPELRREVRPLADLRAAWAIRSAVRAFRPDLVSLHASKAGALGRIATLAMDVPVLYTPHCWSFVDGFPKARLYRWLERCLAPLATVIFTVCEDEKRYGLRRGVGREEQVVTIHNGVRKASLAKRSGRDGPDGRTVRILMVGRFEEQKNQRLLIDSLAGLGQLDWSLTLVGEGPYRADCERRAQDLGIADRVDFAGYSDRVASYLASHDVFALITNWEGFPRSILEAMAAGLPAVVSDVGGNREAVDDGVTGRVLHSADPAQLAAIWRWLLADPGRLRAMGEAARERFERRFTFETMYEKYLLQYGALVSGRRSTRERQQERIGPPTTDARLPNLPVEAEQAKLWRH